MPRYRIGQAADVLGVSTDTVRRWADGGRLPTVRTDGGQRLVEGEALAALAAQIGGGHRPAPIYSESARNRFEGIVTRVIKDTVMAQVDMQAGPHRIVSLMSREAADELGLAPGVRAVAAVKATNVVVELPSQS
ncbi:MAG TPA: helix-turn-helix transcriptional regulator [Candidatus Dormibacteraeota bacterium]|nr:helix-turn-helix transcriptional regulator [Candidatus Dormibacteraeota bacterium]